MPAKGKRVTPSGLALDNDIVAHIRKQSAQTEVPMARIASNALRAHFKLPKQGVPNGEPKPAA